jgi:ADP-ribosyl-[dinitrogen reductase] hydrolase
VSSRKIHSLKASSTGARIALCACPGPEPSLTGDLEALREWGARGLVSLIEDSEFETLGVQSLPDRLAALGMRWWHLPIRDMETPDARFETRWEHAGAELKGLIAQGASIAVHCRGGLGRTGMIAARILVELGTEPAAAIAQVRKVRPGAIETRAQEAFVYACRPRC